MVDVKEKFAPIAANIRKTSNKAVYLIQAGFVLGFIGATGAYFEMPIIFVICLVGFFICVLLALKILVGARSIQCPNCNGSIYILGKYCPQCGSAEMEGPSLMKLAYCKVCNSKIAFNKRNFPTIRNCSSCGVRLDDTGF